MKTLFFGFTCFLLGQFSSPASDQVKWQPVTAKDFSTNAAPATSATLPNLQKALRIGASLSEIVTTCGLPAVKYCPILDLPQHGFVMSGGIIYINGFIVGDQKGGACSYYRYDLPEAGTVYITTDGNQHILYAYLKTTEEAGNPSRYLIGKPNPTQFTGKPPNSTP